MTDNGLEQPKQIEIINIELYKYLEEGGPGGAPGLQAAWPARDMDFYTGFRGGADATLCNFKVNSLPYCAPWIMNNWIYDKLFILKIRHLNIKHDMRWHVYFYLLEAQ